MIQPDTAQKIPLATEGLPEIFQFGAFADSAHNAAKEIAGHLLKIRPDFRDERCALPVSRELLHRRSLRWAEVELRRAQANGTLSRQDPAAQPVDLSRLQVTAGTVCGFKNFCIGEPNQDAIACCSSKDLFIGVIADGVSKTQFSAVGAALLSAGAARIADELLRTEKLDPLSKEFLGRFHAGLYEEFFEISRKLSLSPAVATYYMLCSTLLIQIITPRDTLILGIGDGSFIANNRLVYGTDTCGIDKRLIEDPKTQSSYPPLLTHLVVRDLSRERATPQAMPAADSLRNRTLLRAAKSLHIYHYSPTASALGTPLTMTSDGFEHCADAPSVSSRKASLFPLLRLLDKEAADNEISALCHLYHLATEPLRGQQSPHKVAILAQIFTDSDSCPLPEHLKLFNALVKISRDILRIDSTEPPASTVQQALRELSPLLTSVFKGKKASATFEKKAIRAAREIIAPRLGLNPRSSPVMLYDDLSYIRLTLTSREA